MQKRRTQPLEQPLTFTRADPAELARFDPSTKICMMNCGPHRADPRTSAERKLLCPECWPNAELCSERSESERVTVVRLMP